MTYQLINATNECFANDYKFDLAYCDMIYEDQDIMKWLKPIWQSIKINGILIIQTDWHTNWLVRYYLETHDWFVHKPIFVNHAVWKNEWGNHPKRMMHQCYDDIIIYAKGKDYKFYPEKIQVDKVTKNKGLNPSGRQTKTATAWIDDICLTTTSKERIKKSDGHLIKWQKPLRLMDRIISPFTDEEDWIYDPFAGSATLGEWCILNNRNYIGREIDKEVYNLALNRLSSIKR